MSREPRPRSASRPTRAPPRPLRRGLLVAASLLGVAGCGGCGGTGGTGPVPRPDSVAVEPGEVYSSPGRTVVLTAAAFDPAGHVFSVSEYGAGLNVSWTSPSSGVALTPSNAGSTVVTIPDTPGTDVVVTATVTRVSDGVAAVSSPAVIHVAPVGPPGDGLTLEYPDGLTPVTVVLDSPASSGCAPSWTVAVAGKASFSQNFAQGCGIAVFARDREMLLLEHFDDGSTASAPWTPAVDDWTRSSLPPHLLRGFGVVVASHPDAAAAMGPPPSSLHAACDPAAPTPQKKACAMAAAEVEAVQELFDRNRMGLTLSLDHFRIHSLSAGISGLDAACTASWADQVFPPSEFGVPTGQSTVAHNADLFVVFVSDIVGDRRGHACPPLPGSGGQVLFLSWNEYTSSTLAHELGHALGLRGGQIGGANGHTNGMTGFDERNIMHSARSLELRRHQDHLSVGQVYRMNVDPQSWLYRVSGVGGAEKRDCQTDTGAGVCPPVAADPGG